MCHITCKVHSDNNYAIYAIQTLLYLQEDERLLQCPNERQTPRQHVAAAPSELLSNEVGTTQDTAVASW